MSTFLGMRGTDDFVADQDPGAYRKQYIREYPNGSVSLMALTGLMPSEKLNHVDFNWWTKSLPVQGGAVTGVYTDAGLSTAYVSGGASGDTLYVKMAEATADEAVTGSQVVLSDTSNLDVDVVGKVLGVVKNGASSYCAVQLREADDNSAVNDLSDADYIRFMGTINPQGGAMIEAVSYNPAKISNTTQIVKTSLSITRTAMQTDLRTPQAYQEAKREAFELHGIAWEKILMHGIASDTIGSNGQRETTTMGLIPVIRQYGTTSNYVTDETYDATTWLNGGLNWLEEKLEIMFRTGSMERLCFCGSQTIKALNQVIKANSNYNISGREIGYGMKVMEFFTPYGTVYFKLHPLFTQSPIMRNTAVFFEPANLKWRFIQDTKFIPDTSSGSGRIDGLNEEWLTEGGLEYHLPSGWAFLTGWGSDNPA